MGVSPVLGMAENSVSVQAAPIAHAKGVHNTYGKNSRVKLTKTMKFVDRFGKKTSKPAPKVGITLFGTLRQLMVKLTTASKLI